MTARGWSACQRTADRDKRGTARVRHALPAPPCPAVAMPAMTSLRAPPSGGGAATRARLKAAWQLGVLLVPGFSMMAFSSIVEPLRAANRLTGRGLYQWHLLSAHGGVVTASNEIGIVTAQSMQETAHEMRPLDMLLVCAGSGGQRFRHAASLRALKAYAAAGTPIGGVSSGPHILARAGLLNGCRCTVHWEDRPAFREEFPRLDVSSRLYEIDRGRYTCAGGIAGMDMMLEVIAEQHGEGLAARVADQFIRAQRRPRTEEQQSVLSEVLRARSSHVGSAITLMEQHPEDPLSLSQLAEAVGITPRHLNRLFVQQLQSTPAQYQLELRLQRARTLLENTALTVTEVALATGFGTPQLLARRFNRRFGHTPTGWREARNPLQRDT